MNEENNKKRNKIIIIVAVLFLLNAGIITVYSFKNTKAEEIESFIVDSEEVVVPPFYELMESYSGIKLKTSIKSNSGMSFYYKTTNSSSDQPYYDILDSIELQDVNCTYNVPISVSLVKSQTIPKTSTTTISGRPWYLTEFVSDGTIDGDTTICDNSYCCSALIKGYPISYVSATSDYLNFYINGSSYGHSNKGTAVFAHVYKNDNPYGGQGYIKIQTANEYYPLLKDRNRVYAEENDGSIYFDRPMLLVTLDGNGGTFDGNDEKEMIFIQKTSDLTINTMVVQTTVPTRDNWNFVGWKLAGNSEGREGVYFDSENPEVISVALAVDCNSDVKRCYRSELSLKAVWEKEDSSDPSDPSNPNHPSYSVYYKDSIGHNTVYTKTHSSSNFTIINGKNDYCVGTDANKIFSYWKNMTDTSDTKKYCLDTTSGCTESIPIPSGKTYVTLKAVCSSNSGGGSTPKYTLTLKKNCSGTFKCVSDTNSEVCNQLKNNGKFTKTIAKGDTFTFPKTFDTLTCDGNEINSWGSFDLGYELNVTSDVTASAKWKSSSGGGNSPSNDEYTVTLNRNCSGTFVCSSTTNSEVCTQLKNNGKFTKTFTKGDTFVFPKTFDTLTCDGKEISSWGSYSLGTNITVNKNIDIDAAWDSSNGGGDTPDPSQNDDPIDNPQTGSIVIYLVLLFGIGALVYSVWYFRGFREN